MVKSLLPAGAKGLPEPLQIPQVSNAVRSEQQLDLGLTLHTGVSLLSIFYISITLLRTITL